MYVIHFSSKTMTLGEVDNCYYYLYQCGSKSLMRETAKNSQTGSFAICVLKQTYFMYLVIKKSIWYEKFCVKTFFFRKFVSLISPHTMIIIILAQILSTRDGGEFPNWPIWHVLKQTILYVFSDKNIHIMWNKTEKVFRSHRLFKAWQSRNHIL